MKRVSVPVLRRLPVYHHFLTELRKSGMERVSSTVVAKQFGFDPIKVRKDLSLTGAVGKPKIGFEINELLEKIEEFLGWGNPNEVVLVGCGALGSALMGYEGFARRGWEVLVGFDIDEAVIGTKIHGKIVMPMEKLPDLCRRIHVDIGIITVPAGVAQEVADFMIDGGIRGIWNFSPTSIKVPEGIVLQQENLLASLTILHKKIQIEKHKVPTGTAST